MTAGSFLLAAAAVHAGTVPKAALRLDPHVYGGKRGAEPSAQVVAQAQADWRSHPLSTSPWAVRWHVEAETQGRRDVVLDVDRAWTALPLGESSDTAVFLGRLHPWELLDHPAAEDPWGLVASREAQNRGLLLGYGLHPRTVDPQPILTGWLGAHFRARGPSLGIALSASPFFVPSQGPELSLFTDRPATVGRFARRPPALVELNGRRLPVRYELDRSRLWQDVIFQPQASAALELRYTPQLTAWLTLSRHPSPDGEPETTSRLHVADDGVVGYAVVRPKFPQRWDATLTHAWRPGGSAGPGAWASLFASDDRSWGGELGLGGPELKLSVLHEVSARNEPGRYGEWLLRAGGGLALGASLLHLGGMTHLTQRDLWLRGGLRFPVGTGIHCDLGGDLFAGDERSYFGEWRSNDRIYLALEWEIGS